MPDTHMLTPVNRPARRLAAAACVLCLVGGVAARSTPPDALYLVWEQHWTLKPDGAIVYQQKQHVQLNSDRVYRRLADPRITYDRATQTLELLAARTRLPDGKYVELPPYAATEVAPDAAGGLPAFAALTQRVLVMPGVQPGCVLETEYRLTTRAGVRPWLQADLEIDNHYPVKMRTITVTLPPGVELKPVISGLGDDEFLYSIDRRGDGSATHRWIFADLPERRSEPHGIPWPDAGVRLALTTGPVGDEWVISRLQTVAAAADITELVEELAGRWSADALGPADKLAAVQRKFAETFRLVSFDAAWRPAEPRSAGVVLEHAYGLPEEAGAALLALARAAGVNAVPGLLVANNRWEPQAAQASMVSAYVVVLPTADGPLVYHPTEGRIYRDARWNDHTVLYVQNDKVQRLELPAWNDAADSRCEIGGAVEIDPDGRLEGRLSVRLTGLFASRGALDTHAGQKRRLARVLEHVLPDAKLGDFSVSELSESVFAAEIELEPQRLDKPGEMLKLELAQDDPAIAEGGIPTAHSRRATPARLAGAFEQRIDLRIEWPGQWKAVALPDELPKTIGRWGFISQTVEQDQGGLTLRRRLQVAQRDLPADAVLELRRLVNELRAGHCRTLLLEQP